MERDDVAGQAMGPTQTKPAPRAQPHSAGIPLAGRWPPAGWPPCSPSAVTASLRPQQRVPPDRGSRRSEGVDRWPAGVPSASRGTPGAQTSAGSLAASASTASSARSESRTSADRSENATAGIITAFSGDSITLRTRERSTLVVIVTSATVLQEGTTKVASSALKKGDLAMVVGSTSSDGTVRASTITFGSTPNGAPGTGASAPTA